MTDIITTESASTDRASTDLVVVRTLTPAVFDSPEKVDDVLAALEREVAAHEAERDISTEVGRARIASVAYKIARSKTALDEMGKDLVAGWKAQAELVDKERRKIRTRLDDLKDEFRAPLTQWEEAERGRVAGHEEAIARLVSYQTVDGTRPSAQLKECLNELEAFYRGRDWQEFAQRASQACDTAQQSLERKIERARKEEVDRAELDRLRREDEERRLREREERIAAEARREAEEKAAAEARREAKRAELHRLEAERHAQAERERLEREREEAEERARTAEAHAQRRADEAAARERQRIADEQAAAEAEAERRENNKRIRARVNNVAAGDIVQAGGVSLDVAKAIVTAIAQGRVRHVSIEY